ncbi:actinodin1 isoform X1 [Entelurus aequoreus]|uniref:actinodin1 isoform X1 n=2 Tax=Entelurus aequoreus TaxID=161455 RepID=UPI002B1E461A|nr:actinodin1 isoform X1 [Entelurus aequoreus]XP_061877958.1 actinodin1 isoform X1 [Entelurus aequoreus]
MAGARRTGVTALLAATLMLMLLPADVSAGPIASKAKRDAGESIQEKAAAAAAHRRLIRNRRNISWYKQHSDFWGWYKYFTDNGNQEAIQEMDRIYLAYLQNKNRAESRRSYKAYLSHLGDIYKSCADSEDPNCVASYTSRPKPEPPKPAPVKTCDPTKDAHCLYAALVSGKSPYLPLVLPASPPAPAPVKTPAPLYVRSSPAKEPQSGYHYFAPSSISFLPKEQKAELLRICGAEDVECLQYHLRAAYGYSPSGGAPPSYAQLGCDPQKDPTCIPQLVPRAPSGLHLKYPNCDPLRDPYCAYSASQAAPRASKIPAPAGIGSCNPLFEDGCNPLTATKFASPPESYQQEEPEEAAALRVLPPAAEHYNDPYAMYRDAYTSTNSVSDPYAMYRQANAPASPPANDPYAMLRRLMAHVQVNDPYSPPMEAAPESNPNDPFSAMREAAAAAMHRHSPPATRHQYPFSQPNYEEPIREERHPLGPPGKTKEGYDCFIGYDRECFPLKPTEPRPNAHRRIPFPAEAYEPHLNADGSRSGVLEPSNPHCDPEYDPNCRLRRFEPEQAQPQLEPEPSQAEAAAAESERMPEQDSYEAEPYQSGQEEPHMSFQPQSHVMPTLQDILRRYGDQFPEQGDYRKK